MTTVTEWNKRLAAYTVPDGRRSTTQLILTLALFVAAISGAHAAHALYWALGLPISVIAGILIVRLFIIQHDCGHRSFFRSPRACDWVGRGLSVLTFTPYEYWRRDHDKHHATSSNLDRRGHGDITTLTVSEYDAMDRRGRLGYRIYRNPAVLFGFGPAWQFLLRYRVPLNLGKAANRRRMALSIVGHDAALVAFFGALSLVLGWKPVAVVWLPAVVTAATIGVWLFYVQHAFEGTYWERSGDWSFVDAALRGCSYYRLPRWIHWLTGSIGYHHIHHLSSRIPNYRLAGVFRDVPDLQHVQAIGIVQSIKGARLSLWCEHRRRLVSFREAARPISA